MCKCQICGLLRDDIMYRYQNIVICEDCLEMFQSFDIIEDIKNKQQGGLSSFSKGDIIV